MNVSSTSFNPFPGVRSYEIEENDLFFGREEQIEELVSLMSATRFVAITGASGCGKSSLIKAGFIPRLTRTSGKDTSKEWEFTLFSPGEDPIGRMAEAFSLMARKASGSHVPARSKEELEKELRSGNDGLTRLFNEIPSISDRNLLIVIDQFEELFRFKRSYMSTYTPADAAQFVDLILHALDQSSIPVYIIISMRSDFIDKCTDYPGLTEKINHGYYLVPRMTERNVRAAITGPVIAKGAHISEKLVNRLLEEVRHEPDQLPVLQHALMRTWGKWSQVRDKEPQIDVHHYESIGTMKEALSLHAEEAFHELQGERQQLIAEKLFKALVVVGEDSRGSRRPTQLAEICSIANAKQEEVAEVINCFRQPGRSFLMPPMNVPLNEESIIDITHESIMRIWQRLHDWVVEETNSAQLYLRLAKSAELYQEGKTGLWVDPELHLAINWKEHTHPNQSWANRYDPAFDRAINFLNYSHKEAERAIALKEERQHRELVRARRFAIILGIASIVSIFFLIISINLTFKAEASEKKSQEKEKLAQLESLRAAEQRKEAVIQRRISEQQQQIAEQQKRITEEQKEFAIQQQQIAIREQKEAVLQRQLAEEAKNEAVEARDEAQEQRRIALEQKQIAETERTKAEISEQNARRLRLVAVANSMAIKSIEMQQSLTGDLPGLLAVQAYRMNLENEGPPRDPDIFRALSGASKSDRFVRIHQNEVRAVAAGTKGKTLYSCSLDGTVKIVDRNTPDILLRSLKTNSYGQDGFFSLAVSADERYVAAGTYDGSILTWDLTRTDPEPEVLTGHGFIVTTLCFNESSGELASGSADGSVLLWNLSGTEVRQQIIDQSSARVSALCFSPDGNILAWANEDGAIRWMNLKSMAPLPVLIQPSGPAVYSLAISPDGKLLASGDATGAVMLWSGSDPGKPQVSLIGHISRVSGLLFIPDDQLMASCSFDGTIRLWDYMDPDNPPIVIDDFDFWITCMDLSPDQKSLIAGSADKSIRIKRINMGDLVSGICSGLSRNMTLEEWNKYVGTDIGYSRTCSNLP